MCCLALTGWLGCSGLSRTYPEAVAGGGGAEAGCASVLPRPNTAFARITRPMPVNSNATPTTMLKIASISDMNPMSSAAEVLVTRGLDITVAGDVDVHRFVDRERSDVPVRRDVVVAAEFGDEGPIQIGRAHV